MLIVLGALQVVGISLSELLIQAHIEFKLGDEHDSGLCAASELFSCKAAAGSVYSELFGIPIAALGEAYYICVLLVLACSVWLKPDWKQSGLTVVGITAALSVLYSLFLGGVSYWSLGTLCPLCIGLYVVNILSFLILFALSRGAELRSWSAHLFHPVAGVMLILMGISVIGTQSAYALRHQSAHHRLKEFRKKMKKRQRARQPVLIPVTLGQAPIRGPRGQSMIIEFSDFQCPFCRRFTGYLKKAFESPEGQPFSYAFRHFPLSSECNPHVKKNMHPRACQAAIAAICAQDQGKFWEMHDTLFAHQRDLDDDDLARYAQEIGLNDERFSTCVKSDAARARLDFDIAEAKRYGVPATPVFFVNGWRHFGAKRPKKIRAALAKYPYQGTPSGDLRSSPKSSGDAEAPSAPTSVERSSPEVTP